MYGLIVIHESRFLFNLRLAGALENHIVYKPVYARYWKPVTGNNNYTLEKWRVMYEFI